MSQVKTAGGAQALPVMSQGWSPEMAEAMPLCTKPTKQTYGTRREATEVAKAARRRNGPKLEPYQCSCGKFHLTKHRRT